MLAFSISLYVSEWGLTNCVAGGQVWVFPPLEDEEHRAVHIVCIQSLSLIFSFFVENNAYSERTDFTMTHKSVGVALKLLLNKIAAVIT